MQLYCKLLRNLSYAEKHGMKYVIMISCGINRCLALAAEDNEKHPLKSRGRDE